MRNPLAAVKIVPCGYCVGTGKIPAGYGGLARAECPVCLGRGRLTVPADVKRCAGCNGTGRHYTNYFRTTFERHFSCRGTGVVRPPAKATPPRRI